jgi:16S rRNA (adenine1518-N6/adenine1519-N6)-dimethyltransferase
MVEIGPGQGALTASLGSLVSTLLAVDLDQRVIRRLEHAHPDGPVQFLHQDFLKLNLTEWASRYGCRLRIAGNIPYNITSPILFHLLDHRAALEDATIMMQREVARRLVARPRSKDYGILSVFFQLFADIVVLFDVSPNAFYPKPRVMSSVVRLTFLHTLRYEVVDEQFFRTMVRSVFGKRRKTLRNSLAGVVDTPDAILPASFDLQQRPEALTVQQLVALSNFLCLHRRNRSTHQSPST